MRKQLWICSGLALTVFATLANANTITVNDSADSGPGNCATTCTLRDAIAVATPDDDIQFAPGLNSPIVLQSELSIGKKLKIAGPGAGALTISGNNTSRVFNITADVTIGDVTIADGQVNGVAGSDGVNAGESGGSGESVGGACVLVASGTMAVLAGVTVRHCSATGGTGGNGANGAPGTPPGPGGPGSAGGPGGSGGSGGTATGAAVQVFGSLSLMSSSVIDAHTIGGLGGNGGNGGSGGFMMGFIGQGGSGGPALGGAVAVGSGGSLRIFNSTVSQGGATGGNGGAAGISGTQPAFGGIGGYATGGLLFIDGSVASASLEFATLAEGRVVGGTGGLNSAGGNGIPSGNAINAVSTLNVLSSVVVGAQDGVDLCYTPTSPNPIVPVANSANLSETTNNSMFTSACNDFSLHATLADTMKPLDVSATPAYMPIWKSPAIDAATSCNDLTGHGVSADQHDTPRSQPQGGACDLGAIEADYIFVDGFGG